MTSSEPFIMSLDATLAEAVRHIETSRFYRSILAGEDVRPLYVAYLREAYHYVSLTSSFTPLAARRMDLSLIKLRQWILTHSAEELGHERMAIRDLEKLGLPAEAILDTEPLAGTWAWVSFFHYQVAIRPPFAAMGVLYFLEGMAAALAPTVAKRVADALAPSERAATTFFREHGVLDVDHLAEQRELLGRYCVDDDDRKVVRDTIAHAARIKRFMLDELAESVLGGT